MLLTGFTRTQRFQRDFRKLDEPLRLAVAQALKDLLNDPVPKALRHHTLSGYRPTIHVVDVTRNHSHQITFECDGTTAVLLRIGTHKEIDRLPR